MIDCWQEAGHSCRKVVAAALPVTQNSPSLVESGYGAGCDRGSVKRLPLHAWHGTRFALGAVYARTRYKIGVLPPSSLVQQVDDDLLFALEKKHAAGNFRVIFSSVAFSSLKLITLPGRDVSAIGLDRVPLVKTLSFCSRAWEHLRGSEEISLAPCEASSQKAVIC